MKLIGSEREATPVEFTKGKNFCLGCSFQLIFASANLSISLRLFFVFWNVFHFPLGTFSVFADGLFLLINELQIVWDSYLDEGLHHGVVQQFWQEGDVWAPGTDTLLELRRAEGFHHRVKGSCKNVRQAYSHRRQIEWTNLRAFQWQISLSNSRTNVNS